MLRIVTGDLLDQDVEVIVNAWNRNVLPWWLLLPRGVSGAIKRRAGYAPFRELARLGPIPAGGAVVTGAGRLPQRAIIHVAGLTLVWTSSEAIVRKCVASALALAAARGFRSIAFPLIGAGTGGLSPERVIAAMQEKVERSEYDGEVRIVRLPAATSRRVIPKERTPEPMSLEFTFHCRCCGKQHVGLPDFAFDAPDYYAQLSDDERQMMAARKSDDLCTVGEHRFVRGILLIPVLGLNTDFGLGVWVSLSHKNFDRYVELYDASGAPEEEPFFGWFCNQVPSYPETLALKTLVHLQPYPGRPLIVLEPTDHPLSVHQHQGIDVATLQQFLEAVLHPA